jgi:MoxR-like ATPase
VQKILSPQQIMAFQDLVMRVPISEPSIELAVRLVRRTRPDDAAAPAEVREFVTYGAGPRASQHIVLAAKARAILEGRPVVDGSDIKALAYPVLRHRILTNFHAEARKVTTDDIVAKVIEGVM